MSLIPSEPVWIPGLGPFRIGMFIAHSECEQDSTLYRVNCIKIVIPEFANNRNLLVAMGYGGSCSEAGKRVGKTGDDGIDGIIKEDKLGLDTVCIQVKRWQNTVVR